LVFHLETCNNDNAVGKPETESCQAEGIENREDKRSQYVVNLTSLKRNLGGPGYFIGCHIVNVQVAREKSKPSYQAERKEKGSHIEDQKETDETRLRMDGGPNSLD